MEVVVTPADRMVWRARLLEFQSNKEDQRQTLIFYRDLFGTIPNVPFPLVVLKLEYFLERKSIGEEAWGLKSDKTKLNYEASQSFQWQKLSETLRDLIALEVKEDNMAKVAVKKQAIASNGKKSVPAQFKRAVGKTLKLGIVQTWANVFQDHKTWTDAQISEFMHKEFPDRKNQTFDNVPRTRYDFNSGRLTKGIPPKTPAVAYEPKTTKTTVKK